jgi:hypothetical protein
VRHSAARWLGLCARRLPAANQARVIGRIEEQGCLNIVAALRPMPQARWQCLKISGTGQRLVRVAQLRWQKPAHGSDNLAVAQIHWQRTSVIIDSTKSSTTHLGIKMIKVSSVQDQKSY